jgi:hypothetical protein
MILKDTINRGLTQSLLNGEVVESGAVGLGEEVNGEEEAGEDACIPNQGAIFQTVFAIWKDGSEYK